jgi:hypothetical protein
VSAPLGEQERAGFQHVAQAEERFFSGRVATGLGNSFSDDGAMNDSGETDLIHLLQLHETYHRGQITLLSYVYARLNDNSVFSQLKVQRHCDSSPSSLIR